MNKSPKSHADSTIIRPPWWKRPRLAWAALFVIIAIGLATYGWSQQTTTPAIRPEPSQATKDKPWTNSLGMAFVPVPKTKVLFCIWETRVKDYQAFANAKQKEWLKPDFQQGPDHPAVLVSWEEAQEFCKWLTEKERGEGRLTAEQRYRLPTDVEWSYAVGIGEREGNGTPKDKDGKIENVYPWGNQWPPPNKAGNYADFSSSKIAGFTDGYERTAPVGSFKSNELGIFDLGGNVWEWCEDFYDGQSSGRVLRGASWFNDNRDYLLSAFRNSESPFSGYDSIGFRVVLVVGATP